MAKRNLSLLAGIVGGVIAAGIGLAIFAGCLWAFDAAGIRRAPDCVPSVDGVCIKP